MADFSGTPTSGIAPLGVVFSNQSSGNYASCAWTFGDGNTSTTCNPSHTYTAAGTYSVSLTVTGPGGSNTQTKTNYITVSGPPPTPDFTALPLTGQAPLTVGFTNNSTDTINSWLWDFGDGNTSTPENPWHSYSVTGTFTISLTATGPGGSQTKVKANYIRIGTDSIIANFSAQPTVGPSPLAVQFSDESAGNINNWQWDFGDGTGSTLQHPAHTYSQTGDYTVTLTVAGPSGNNTETKTNYIAVTDELSISLTASNNSPAMVGQVVGLTATITTGDNVAYVWDFGGGDTGAGANITHIYQTAGNFTALVTATNSRGKITATTTVTVLAENSGTWKTHLPLILKQ